MSILKNLKRNNKKGSFSITMDNVLVVFGVLFLILGSILGYFLYQDIGAVMMGAVSSVSQNSAINLSPQMTQFTNQTETNFIRANKSLTANLTLTLQILGIVILLVLFGLSGGFVFNKYKDYKKKKGGNGGNYGGYSS